MKILQQKLDLERKLLNEKMEREKAELGKPKVIMQGKVIAVAYTLFTY